MSARVPEAVTRAVSSASGQVRWPIASSSHVRGSVSTTFGGVPRVWRGPSTHWTAANGGTRTSTLRPGAICSRVRRLRRTAAASAGRSGWSASPRSQGRTACTAARSSAGSTGLAGTAPTLAKGQRRPWGCWYIWTVIRNFAVVGPWQATRERLTAALAAAPDMAVYRIGRGADPLPVSATFDPSDQPGCRSLLDWFERGAPAGAVLLVDDWGLCFEQDPELDRVVEWIAAFGPAQGVQVVVTARQWSDLPDRLRRRLHGEATDFLALHEVDADLSNKYRCHDL